MTQLGQHPEPVPALRERFTAQDVVHAWMPRMVQPLDPLGVNHHSRRDMYGVDVRGCTWSLLDDFESAFGDAERSGIVRVEDDSLHRAPELSVRRHRELIAAAP